MRNKKNAAPVMLIPPGSGPTYGRKHPKDITGLTRTNIIFNIFLLSTFRGKNRNESMEKSNNERPGTKVVTRDAMTMGTARRAPTCGLRSITCTAPGPFLFNVILKDLSQMPR